jgi:Domain of unknown function (DUF6456)
MPKKRRRAPVATDRRFKKSPQHADYGPAERWQHSGRRLELTEAAGVLAARAIESSVIDMLAVRDVLSSSQTEAALKFRLDYQRAALMKPITGSYNSAAARGDFHKERERSDAEEAAYQRWRNAVRKLGLEASNVAISTICFDLVPTPRDILILQKGLERLVEWYGLKKP